MDTSSFVELSFRSRVDPRLRVEVLRLSDVLQVAPRSLARHQFSLVVVPLARAVSIEVDFERLVITPGTVLRVLPGQVHRWGTMTRRRRPRC